MISPSSEELNENLYYLDCKTSDLGFAVDFFIRFHTSVERYGLDQSKYFDLMNHVAEELLKAQTDRDILGSYRA